MVFKSSYSMLPLSKEKIVSKSYLPITKYINDNYDAVIVGSDEVWKIDSYRSFPNIYWLPEIINIPKLSYAASANRTDVNNLNNDMLKYMKKWFNLYDYISVSDLNTYNMIKKIDSSLDVNFNPDPTIFYQEEDHVQYDIFYKKIYKRFNIKLDSDKIICLLTRDKKISEFIKENYGREYKIISMYSYNCFADVFLNNLSPFEWIYIFKFFSFCITSLFHGTLFCIRNGTPFLSFDKEIIYDKYESKIEDLLKKSRFNKSLL